MKKLRLVVVGTVASNPYAGMAWMHMQMAAGLMRLGHDAYYIEATSTWPYDPVRLSKVNDSSYTVPYLTHVAEGFGLRGRWGFRQSYSDRKWFGLDCRKALDLLKHADAVFNVTGATRLRTKEELDVGRLVYIGTDPVVHEIGFMNGDKNSRRTIEQHDDVVTYGENIGNSGCPIPPLPKLRAKTRQPVLLDMWDTEASARDVYTTVGNWKQGERDLEFNGETYHWSKHLEFKKFIRVPRLVGPTIELAMGLVDASKTKPGFGDLVPALGMTGEEREELADNGWQLTDAHTFSHDPWQYRDYIRSSRGEFTVARDMNVRLRSGWFSERSACYLASGRPVITQDTGFANFIPTGKGLFSFNSYEEILEAFGRIEADYKLHCDAAKAIAREHFAADKVLTKLITDLNL